MHKKGIPICLALLAAHLVVSAQQPNLDEAFARLAKWNFDENRDPQFVVSELVVKAKGSPAGWRDLETRFINLLKSDATAASKDFACRQLNLMGTEASVPVLAGMLADARAIEIARYALEGIPGPAASRALREALGKTKDRARIGVINTLGRRRDAASVELLRPLAADGSPATAQAALFALAEIADPAAVRILSETRGATAAVASLKAADLLTARGDAAAAVPVYKRLYAAGESGAVRAGALRGLSPMPADALTDPDARVQAAAIDALARTAPRQLVVAIPKLGDAGQVYALGALGGPAALPAFTAALKSPSKTVRIAALEGLGRAGDASFVPALAQIAAGADEAEQTVARASLGRMPGKAVDQAVVDGMAGAGQKVRLELIRAAGERGTTAAAGALLKMSRDADSDVRRESLRALREVGSAGDIPPLVALVVNPVQAGDRAEAARGLASVLRRSDPARIGDVLSAYTPASDMEARAALLQVMGQSGNPQALTVLRTALKDQDASLKRAAILALGEWPDPAPIPDLFQAARAATDPAQQVLALRGALKLLGLPTPARPAPETVKLLAEAMALARQPEEKRAVLALLARFPTRDALELAKKFIEDPDVAAEAKAAVARLERTFRPRP
jgi:HEAT repeat protein